VIAPEGGLRKPQRNRVWGWLTVGLAAVVGILVLGGLNISHDFAPLSQNAGRFGLYTADHATRTDPVFFITRYERGAQSRFTVVIRQDMGPSALVRTVVAAEIHSGGDVSHRQWTCGPNRPDVFCQSELAASVGEDGSATITLVDYDAEGAEIGRMLHVFELRKIRRISPRFWDSAMSV